ncbi:unnamed protein product [Rotaria sp. Silwood2]|nr:unnamed protein product [Rotaria sp. Silwood2]CAF3073759.1 unnamed protein product [Rotaria sp. Silwood2]CAF3150435.1 unnamed protein product [Rotaria sp. Silwood2]CAF4179965.1 unnamed protein product [Rotaria sp. Silwood2]CAF4348608.1 unnamed protein product [Rotaria sp. Silwood2]
MCQTKNLNLVPPSLEKRLEAAEEANSQLQQQNANLQAQLQTQNTTIQQQQIQITQLQQQITEPARTPVRRRRVLRLPSESED